MVAELLAPSTSGVEMGEPIIELTNIVKTYTTGVIEFIALHEVSLTITRGEYAAVMGPSGSGKSTLMNILGCLDVATSGSYVLDRQDVSTLDESDLALIRNRLVGFVFQQFNLLPALSAWRNVELPLAYAGVGAAERKERAMAALARVGLAAKATNRPGEMSGGQQQRVAIARALVTEPAVILADEPTGNLDSVATGDVLELLDDLHAAGGTVVLITHEDAVAAQAGRIVTMTDGRIASDLGREAAQQRRPSPRPEADEVRS